MGTFDMILVPVAMCFIYSTKLEQINCSVLVLVFGVGVQPKATMVGIPPRWSRVTRPSKFKPLCESPVMDFLRHHSWIHKLQKCKYQVSIAQCFFTTGGLSQSWGWGCVMHEQLPLTLAYLGLYLEIQVLVLPCVSKFGRCMKANFDVLK